MRGESEDRAKVQIGLRPVERWKPEYRVRSTDYGGKVGAWLRRALLWWRSRRSLAPTRERCSREAARLARSANPTSIQADGRFSALSNRQTLTAIRYLMYLIDSALSTPYSVLRAAGPRPILLDNIRRICTVVFVLSKPSPQAQPSKSQDRKAA